MLGTSLVDLLRRTFWISIATTVLVGATVVAVATAHRDSERLTRHSREVVRKARRAQLLALDRATAVRGFLLTGDSATLGPDLAARGPLASTLDSLVRETADNPPQQRRARAFAGSVLRWDSTFARPALEQRARLGVGGVTAQFGAGGLAGKLLFDDIRLRFEEFEEEEESLYQARSAWAIRLQFINVGIAVGGLFLLGLIQSALRRRVADQATALVDRQEQLESQAIELEEQAAELEEQATELESQTEELQTTVVELTRKNEELDAFSASVAHDLRSPLRSIDGFSHLLLSEHEGQLGAEGSNALRRIRANTKRMGEMIDGLLLLARVSAGELRFEETDVSELATSVGAELQRALPAERSVEYHVDPGLSARGDVQLLRIALRNLVENGFKFTRGTDAGRVTVGSTVMHGRQTFYVADNGVGFDMRYAGKLFAPFERLHHNTNYEGTGVGLATVRRVVERHGGRVWAEAEPGRGATFYFTLAA